MNDLQMIADFFDACDVSFVCYNSETNKYTLVNDSFIETIGYSKEILLSETIDTFLSKSSVSTTKSRVSHLTDEKKQDIMFANKYIHGVTGAEISITWFTDMRDIKTNTTNIISFGLDITNILERLDNKKMKIKLLNDLLKLTKPNKK